MPESQRQCTPGLGFNSTRSVSRAHVLGSQAVASVRITQGRGINTKSQVLSCFGSPGPLCSLLAPKLAYRGFLYESMGGATLTLLPWFRIFFRGLALGHVLFLQVSVFLLVLSRGKATVNQPAAPTGYPIPCLAPEVLRLVSPATRARPPLAQEFFGDCFPPIASD